VVHRVKNLDEGTASDGMYYYFQRPGFTFVPWEIPQTGPFPWCM
jgi:hypothetical protein